jgi:hypothetical protein
VTAPRIVSAYEAEGLLRHGTDAELAAAAPDLAASVVALHALLDEAYDIIVSQRNPAWDGWCDRVCRIDLEATP